MCSAFLHRFYSESIHRRLHSVQNTFRPPVLLDDMGRTWEGARLLTLHTCYSLFVLLFSFSKHPSALVLYHPPPPPMANFSVKGQMILQVCDTVLPLCSATMKELGKRQGYASPPSSPYPDSKQSQSPTATPTQYFYPCPVQLTNFSHRQQAPVRPFL